MISGRVKWFNKTKGYGFICPEDGSEDVFIHVTVLEKTGMRYLEEEQDVKFETEIKNGRLRAINIEVDGATPLDISPSSPTLSDEADDKEAAA
tara:strand:+ start:3848 stop:4126 length:279 start_codon:yes stop_codon:yes gene_type:complete